MELIKIRKELINRFSEYKRTLMYMMGDAPIAVLCLPKKLEKKLLANSCLRVYDMINLDLSEIEWLSDLDRAKLASSLDEFFSVLD